MKIKLDNYRQKSLFTEAINITFIIYALLLPFSIAFSIFTGPYVLFGLWLLEGNWEQKRKIIKKSKPAIFLILFLFFNILSLLWSDDIKEGIHNLKYYFAITSIFVIANTSLKKEYIKIIISSFLVSMFVSEVILYGIYFELWSTSRGDPSNPSPFMHHVHYSLFLSTTIIVLFWRIFKEKDSLKVKIIESIFLISTFINLFLNVGRTGQVSFIFASIIFTLVYFRAKIKYIFILFLFLSSIFFIAYNLSTNFHKRVHEGISNINDMKSGNFNTSWGARVLMKQEGFKIVQKSPIIGFGIGDDKSAIRNNINNNILSKKNPILKKISHIHDQILQIMIQTGIVGTLLFIIFIISIFREKYSDHLTKSILFSILSLFIIAFFIDTPIRGFSSALFGFLVGMFVALAKDENDKIRNS